MRTKRLSAVGMVMGLIVGGTLAFAGVTFAGTSPPTHINTCTKVNKHGVYGNPKVTTASSCTGTKFFQSWTGSSATGEIASLQSQVASLQSQNASLSVYQTLLKDSNSEALGRRSSPTISYANVNFNAMNLPVSGLNGGDFEFASFIGAALTDGVSGGSSSWQHDDFTGTVFGLSDEPGFPAMAFGNFTDSTFEGAQLFQAYAVAANFTGADLTAANLGNAIIDGANFTNANLAEANFSGASTVGEFSGVTYSNTICPNGTNSNGDGGTCHGQGGGL